MLGDDVGDPPPPFRRHHGARRRLQARGREQHARPGVRKGTVERLGQKTVRIAVDPVKPVAVLRRQRDHAGIGEPLRQHHVLWCRHHIEGDRERMLAAMGDEEVGDVGLDAECRKPFRHDLAM